MKGTASAPESDSIEIIGADENNLKHIDLALPRGKVTLVTGVSGSGKSSLLSDTLASEADRRMELFLGVTQGHQERTDGRAFVGRLPPSVHVGQRAFRASERTTVGTSTGFLAALRRLFIRHARPYADGSKQDVPDPSPETYADWLLRQYQGRVRVWAVPVRFVATDGVTQIAALHRLGITEVIIRSETDTPSVWEKGKRVPLPKFKPLRSTVRHIVEAEIGSMDVSAKANRDKLLALLRRAFDAGNGSVLVELPGAWQAELQGPFGPRIDSRLHYVQPDCARCFALPSAHLLSFNAPEHPESGACPTCQGIGKSRILNEQALIAHPERSMHEGAFSLFTEKNYKYVNIQHETIEGLRGMRGFSPDVPWKKLSSDARRLILEGSDGELIFDRDLKTARKMSGGYPFPGFRRAILERVTRGTKTAQSLAHLVTEGPCTECEGTRWSYQARALRVAGMRIDQLLTIPFVDLVSFTDDDASFTRAVDAEGRGLVRLINHHARAFVSVGLGHLAGDRGMLTLSEGEVRRTRLAGVLNVKSAGLGLFLDEPARGLHDEDVRGLAGAITELAHAHTVVLNDHRHALAHAADVIVELGPGAGAQGGEVVYIGPVANSSWKKEPCIERRPQPISARHGILSIRGATIHNLSDANVEIPLGSLTCLTGVSGSGKSSFVRGVLIPALTKNEKDLSQDGIEISGGSWKSISGAERIKGLIALTQKAPPANRRSLVATFLAMADPVRTAFGATDAARQLGLCAADFSLNSGKGRCQVCLGIGDVEEHHDWVPCPVCGGTRFGQEALSVRLDGMNIGELLDLPVSELRSRKLGAVAANSSILDAMHELGIGHIALGRRMDTLSGGEVQRLRIASKLVEHGAGGLLFVLDEPAAGLHHRDVELLARALERIVDGHKNTVVLVEHNLALIRAADWLIEFGPGSGPHGGQIVASGTPAEIYRTDTATGRALSGRAPVPQPRLTALPATKNSTASSDLVQQAIRVKAWLRHLLGQDVNPPEDLLDQSADERPVAILSQLFWQGRRYWELGGLDLELAKLLLDLQVQEVSAAELCELAALWAMHPDAQIQIHPFLDLIQTWGTRLPGSVAEGVTKRLPAMGLELTRANKAKGTAANWLAARATGKRFLIRDGVGDARQQALRDALVIGGGYAELVSEQGTVLRRIQNRLVDLEQGIVGPRKATARSFSRHDLRGQCAMCTGSGKVMAFSEKLVIKSRRAKPGDEGFLHPAAAAIMKGVRRSTLLPFLRRLEEEGLWNAALLFERLEEPQRNLLLFGLWRRPGHGTFLKDAKSDPSEVGSWLRWDGLYRHLAEQVERSDDDKWKSELTASRTTAPCPECMGTGHAAHAQLLMLGERSLDQWIRGGTYNEFMHAIGKLRTISSRQQRTKQRLLESLAPLRHGAANLPLADAAEGALAQETAAQIVGLFSDMPSVFR